MTQDIQEIPHPVADTGGAAHGNDSSNASQRSMGDILLATGRLPQVCDQLGEFLADQRATGRLYEAQGREVAAQVSAARIHLTDAASAARALTRALQAVQADIAGLGVREGDDA